MKISVEASHDKHVLEADASYRTGSWEACLALVKKTLPQKLDHAQLAIQASCNLNLGEHFDAVSCMSTCCVPCPCHVCSLVSCRLACTMFARLPLRCPVYLQYLLTLEQLL